MQTVYGGQWHQTLKMAADKRRVTIAQVAEVAGVARSSVSRAFTRPHLLSAETVKRVEAVAERLGYVPNHSARALSTGRHGNIALIVPDVANPYYPPMIRAAQQQADLSDYCVFLGDSDENPGKEEELLQRLSGQVEGVVLVGSRLEVGRIIKYAAQCPLVLVNRELKRIPRILIDSKPGMRQAVQHLHELGHQEIAYISGHPKSWSNKQRKSAINRMAAELGMKVLQVSAGQPNYEAGKNASSSLLATPATAAITFNDIVAHGVIAGLSEQGCGIPGDMSIIGCDDSLGIFSNPPLSTVRGECAEAGRMAVSVLLEMLASSSFFEARFFLETRLVVRSTTTRPRPRSGSFIG